MESPTEVGKVPLLSQNGEDEGSVVSKLTAASISASTTTSARVGSIARRASLEKGVPQYERRRRRQRGARSLKNRVSVHCTSRPIQMELLIAFLAQKPTHRGLGQERGGSTGESTEAAPSWLDTIYSGIVHCTTDISWQRFSTKEEEGFRHCFFFPIGCIVFWGCTEQEESQVLAEVSAFLVSGNETEDSDAEPILSSDEMAYEYRMGVESPPAAVKRDVIPLISRNPLEKMAFSIAMAQSAKLCVYEERLDHIMEETGKFPEGMVCKGRTGLSNRDIKRLIGRVMTERQEVNLHNDVLDMEYLLWEEDLMLPCWEMLCRYLNVPRRKELMEKRLLLMSESIQVLSAEMLSKHHLMLELFPPYSFFSPPSSWLPACLQAGGGDLDLCHPGAALG
ncbi:unnamed protein product [Chrysoparadoxa australica]